MVKKNQRCRKWKIHQFWTVAAAGAMTKLLHIQWYGVFHSFFIKSFLKYFSLYEFQGRCGVQDRDAWIAGDTSCERISAVVYVVTLFPLTLMQDDIRINLWLDSSGQIRGLESLGFISLTRFSPSGLETTAPVPGRLHAPLLPFQSISSASGYHSVCSLPCPSMLAKSHFLMLTA